MTEYHFTIGHYGVINENGVEIGPGDEVTFIVTGVGPLEDGAVGIDLQFTEVQSNG
jgi:hypothetical protein